MSGSASPLWTQAAAEAHVPVTQETGRQAAPIADLRVRVVSSLEEVAPVLAKRQQGAACQFLSSVCVHGDLAASPKARARWMPPPDPKRGPSLQLSLGTLFCCAPSSPFQGRTRGGAPPTPRPCRRQGFRVPRLWEDAEGSRISPGLGHLSSTPRSLLLQRCAEAQEPGPEGNGLPNARVQREDKSDHLLQGDCDIPPCGGVDTDLKRTARWTSTQTRWPLWDQGEPARPQEAPAFSSEGPGPWTGWHSGLGAPHRHWRGLGPVKIHPGSQFSRRRHHEGAPDLIVPV